MIEAVQKLTINLDNILITEDGVENLTPTPKEIDEITQLVKSG
jgi:Xaa-Pro dipeptidase